MRSKTAQLRDQSSTKFVAVFRYAWTSGRFTGPQGSKGVLNNPISPLQPLSEDRCWAWDQKSHLVWLFPGNILLNVHTMLALLSSNVHREREMPVGFYRWPHIFFQDIKFFFVCFLHSSVSSSVHNSFVWMNSAPNPRLAIWYRGEKQRCFLLESCCFWHKWQK